ncbi:MAG: hypothetical protein ABW110_05510 [Steroidobacteraceae bacterium]
MAIIVPSATPQETLAPLRLPGAPNLANNGLRTTAQNLNQTVDVLSNVSLRMQRERDTTRVFEADVLLDEAWRPKETEFKDRRGTRAFGIQDDASKWWDAEPSKIEAGLENEAQRTAFRNSVARRRGASLDSMAQFEAGERTQARSSAVTAAIATQTSFAAQNFSSPSAVTAARDDIREKVAVQAYLNGWDKNVTEAAQREAMTNLHRQVLENMVDVNPDSARKYLDAVKGEIDGTVWDGLSKTVKLGDELQQAQKLADQIWTSGLRDTAAYDAARKQGEGEVRERALTLLRTRQTEQDKLQNDAKQATVDRAIAAFNDRGLAGLTPSMMTDLQRLSPQTLAALRNRAWTPQDKVVTDWATYEGLKAQIASASVDDLKRMEFSGSLDKLNAMELDALTKLRDSRIKGLPDNVATTQQLLGEAHAQMGWTSDDAERRGLFDRRAREAIDAEQRVTGKDLTDERKRTIIDQLLIQGSVPRNWWLDRSAQFFEVQGTENEPKFQIDIPDDMRTQIEEALTRRNVEVTDENLQKYYRAFLDRQGQ